MLRLKLNHASGRVFLEFRSHMVTYGSVKQPWKIWVVISKYTVRSDYTRAKKKKKNKYLHISLIVDLGRHMVISVNIGSGNGLLPDDAKLLPEYYLNVD